MQPLEIPAVGQFLVKLNLIKFNIYSPLLLQKRMPEPVIDKKRLSSISTQEAAMSQS